jgi:hypothetical protein
MQNNKLRNGVVFAVIFLFIGIAIQPTIAVNPISSKEREDCNICPKVSNLHRIYLKNLSKRIEVLNNKLSVLPKHYSVIAEKYQDLVDRITSNKEINKKLNSIASKEDNPIICRILWRALGVFVGPMVTLDRILTSFEGSKLWNIIEPLFYLAITVQTIICDNILNMIYKYDCDST